MGNEADGGVSVDPCPLLEMLSDLPMVAQLISGRSGTG